MYFPGGSVVKNLTCQCRRHGFKPWSRKIPQAKEQLSPCTTTVEPVLWSPGATTTEPTCCNHWGLSAIEPVLHSKRGPSTATREWPLLSATREKCSDEDADDTTLMAERKELKSVLIKVKEESEKVDLKLNIQKTKITVSSPITSWQIDGETIETFIFLGSKITTDGDWSHEIKRCLLLGKKLWPT